MEVGETMKYAKALVHPALVCAAAVMAATAMAACGQEGGDPDGWEKRHNSYQPPEEVMDSMGIEPGMVIAEVGAGRGRYVVHMARRVGDGGRVYANDIDEGALDYLEFRCKRDSIDNVATILGEVTDPLLPAGILDVVYMINTYHHLDKPVELMRNIIPGLKPDGILAIIEHDPEKHPAGESESTGREELFEQAGLAGFEPVRVMTFLLRDNIYIFRTKDPRDRGSRDAQGH